MHPLRLLLTAIGLSIASLSMPSPARADEPTEPSAPPASPPGFYFRFRAGPDARVAWQRFQKPPAPYYGTATNGGLLTFDSTIPGAGLQLALAAGWAITPRTALAAETAVYTDAALGDGHSIPYTSITGLFGLDATLLLDHYLDASRKGTHVQAAAGVGIAATGSSQVDIGAADNVFDPETVIGPTIAGGIGYDWGAFGVLARVETSYLTAAHTKLVPVSAFLGMSLHSF
jgi:hypothetical protein